MIGNYQMAPMSFDPVTGQSELSHTDALEYRKWHGRVAWLHNPWTGEKRDPRDIGSDPTGLLIQSPEA